MVVLIGSFLSAARGRRGVCEGGVGEGGGVAPPCSRWAIAASTRRLPDSSGSRSSFWKTAVMCFSTLPSVTWSVFAIAWLERPSAIRASTDASRSVRRSIRSSRVRRLSSCATTSGSSTVAPAAMRSIASRKSVTSATRSLRR